MRKMYNDVGLFTRKNTKGLNPYTIEYRISDKPLILTFASAGTKDTYSVAVPHNVYTIIRSHQPLISKSIY